MSDTLSSIGDFVGGKGGAGLFSGVGVLSNIMNMVQQQKLRSQQMGYLKNIQGLISDPSKLTAMLSKLERPLSAGLEKGVGNSVQGYLAERGLSTSPTIQAETMAQTLAPFQQNEQQIALDAVFKLLGLPAGAGSMLPGSMPNVDISGLLKMLQKKPAPSGDGGVDANAGAPGYDPVTGSYPGTSGASASGIGFDPSMYDTSAAPSFDSAFATD